MKKLLALVAMLVLLLLPACREKELTEPELKSMLRAAVPTPLVVFEYDDFDGDGTKEAFAVCAGKVDEEFFAPDVYYDDCQIWFADSNGAVLMKDEVSGFTQDLMFAGQRKLFNWMVSAGGSGSSHLFFGVLNGKPYELKISEQYYFLEERDGEYVGTKGDFSKGWHDRAEFFFRFDDKTGEFAAAQPKVPKPVEKIELFFEAEPFEVGGMEMIGVSITPEDAYNRAIEWSCDNPGVIDEPDAYIEALKPGKATITARSTDGSNVSASIVITVVE